MCHFGDDVRQSQKQAIKINSGLCGSLETVDYCGSLETADYVDHWKQRAMWIIGNSGLCGSLETADYCGSLETLDYLDHWKQRTIWIIKNSGLSGSLETADYLLTAKRINQSVYYFKSVHSKVISDQWKGGTQAKHSPDVAHLFDLVTAELSLERYWWGLRFLMIGRRAGGGVVVVGELYLSLHCYHQNDSCVQMGSDGRHFNVALTAIVKTASTNHNF